MIYQSSDPTKILKNKFDKDDLVFYIRNFLPVFIFMMATPVDFIFLRINNHNTDRLTVIRGGIIILTVNTVMFISAIVIAVINGSRSKKKYNAFVTRYGYDELAAQLNDPENAVFYIHPEKFETYVIITKEFLILSKTMIIRLDEIRQMRFSRVPRGDTSRPYDFKRKQAYETVRFVRMVNIVDNQGKDNAYPVGLSDDDYYCLINYLVCKLGPNIVFLT